MSKNEAKKAALDKALMKYAENKDVLKDNENLKGFVAELKEIKKVVAKKDPLVVPFPSALHPLFQQFPEQKNFPV